MTRANTMMAAFGGLLMLIGASATVQAGIISKDDLTGSIKFTYDGAGIGSSNVTKAEVTNSAFTSVGPLFSLFRPDFYNYGFNMSISGLPSLSATGALTTVAIPGTNDAPAGTSSAWTIDYYSGETCASPCNAADANIALGKILDGTRPRAHTVMSGHVNDLQLSVLGDGSLRAFGHLVVTDGLYHAVTDANGNPPLNDPTLKAIVGGLIGKDLTNVDLTVLEFESILDFNFGSGGTPTGNPNVAGYMVEFESLSSYLATVPEPGTLALFGLGLTGLGFARRRRRM